MVRFCSLILSKYILTFDIVTGTPEAPGRVGVSICDIITGMNGFSAILQGLYDREITGKGSGYKVSLFDSVAEIMNVPYIQQKYTGTSPGRLGLKHPSIAPYGAFTTKDNKSLLISIQNEREWESLCRQVLKNEGLHLDPRYLNASLRVLNRICLELTISQCFASFDSKEMVSKLLDAGIAFGSLNSVEDLVQHPQLRTIDYFTSTGGAIIVPAPAIIQNLSPSYGNVPKLGEHNGAIKREFGR